MRVVKFFVWGGTVLTYTWAQLNITRKLSNGTSWPDPVHIPETGNTVPQRKSGGRSAFFTDK